MSFIIRLFNLTIFHSCVPAFCCSKHWRALTATRRYPTGEYQGFRGRATPGSVSDLGEGHCGTKNGSFISCPITTLTCILNSSMSRKRSCIPVVRMPIWVTLLRPCETSTPGMCNPCEPPTTDPPLVVGHPTRMGYCPTMMVNRPSIHPRVSP